MNTNKDYKDYIVLRGNRFVDSINNFIELIKIDKDSMKSIDDLTFMKNNVIALIDSYTKTYSSDDSPLYYWALLFLDIVKYEQVLVSHESYYFGRNLYTKEQNEMLDKKRDDAEIDRMFEMECEESRFKV